MFELLLFCFHFAGGAARNYDGLKSASPSWLKVRPLDLPGHGARRGEPALTRWEAVVGDSLDQIRRHLDTDPAPVALFGHSMGGLVAREVAHAMTADGRAPVWLGIAGIERSPMREGEPDWMTCPDMRVIERLRELQGTPPDLLENEALMQVVLPVLRADLALCKAYAPRPRPPLECPLLALGGTQDDQTSEQELQSWREATRAAFDVRMVAGDHFFVTTASAEVAAIVADAIARAATGPTSARR